MDYWDCRCIGPIAVRHALCLAIHLPRDRLLRLWYADDTCTWRKCRCARLWHDGRLWHAHGRIWLLRRTVHVVASAGHINPDCARYCLPLEKTDRKTATISSIE